MRRRLGAQIVLAGAVLSVGACGEAADRGVAPAVVSTREVRPAASPATHPGELAESTLLQIAMRYAVGYSIDARATPPRLLGFVRSSPADARRRAGSDPQDPSMPNPVTEMVVFGGFFVVSAPGAEAHFHYAIFSQLPTTGEVVSTMMSDRPVDLSGTSMPPS
jgi:hypothetical protein